MARLVLTLLVVILLTMLAKAFEREFEFENALTKEQKEMWYWRSEASALKGLHLDNSKGVIIIDIGLCLSEAGKKNKKDKEDAGENMEPGGKVKKTKKFTKLANIVKKINKIQDKSKTTNRSEKRLRSLEKKKDRIQNRKDKKKAKRMDKNKISVSIKNIRYSNDGPVDQIKFYMDKTYLANFTTAGEYKGGHGWNEFLDSGNIGSTSYLQPAKHTLSLTIFTDKFGVELDNIRLKFENQDPTEDIFCGATVDFL